MEITQEMIDECVEDTSVGGKYVQLYEMLTNSIKNSYDSERISGMKSTLNFIGIDCKGMSVPEIIYEYSNLI